MPENKIRVGFIGAGGNTKLKHIPGFQKIEGVELVSVANRSLESGQKISAEFGIPNVYSNWQELLEADDCDAICIGTWPYLHSTLVLESLANEKHVLTEARMAMNAPQAHEMLAASHDHPNLVAQIVPAPHTLKLDETIQDLIQNGYLGELISVELNLHEGNFIDRHSPLHWRHNRDLSGFNIMQLGIWYEAMMRWIGPASSVIALTKTEGLDEDIIAMQVEAVKAAAGDVPVLAVSSQAHKGLIEVLRALRTRVEEVRQQDAEKEAEETDGMAVISLGQEVKALSWHIKKREQEDGTTVFVVTGHKIEKFARRTHFDTYEGLNRLRDIMKKMGITQVGSLKLFMKL